MATSLPVLLNMCHIFVAEDHLIWWGNRRSGEVAPSRVSQGQEMGNIRPAGHIWPSKATLQALN